MSEAVAREFRKLNAEVIYMPTTKLKNVVCANMKDTVPNEDKAEVVYLINCQKHDESYIGHTKKPNKERGYEHNVISHADAHSSKAIYTEDDRTMNTREVQEHGRRSERIRNQPQPDYKVLDRGRRQKLTQGNTAVSQQMVEDHDEGDVTMSILCRERHKYSRQVKEGIWIHRQNPSLNRMLRPDGEKNENFNVPPIYHNLLAKKT